MFWTPLEVSHLGLNPELGIEGFFPILNEQSLKQYSEEWKTYESHGWPIARAAKIGSRAGVEVNAIRVQATRPKYLPSCAGMGGDLILMGRNRSLG